MPEPPNYRMVQIQCCATCRHGSDNWEGGGGWECARLDFPQSYVEAIGVCDAYEIENNA